MKTNTLKPFVLVATFLLSFCFLQTAWGEPEIPVKDTVTMVDLGSTSCIPCKMMEPVLENLTKEYKGRAAILFVDVMKDREMARKFNIRAIPTQVFFDTSGKEVWRHAGFLDQKTIEGKLNTLLGK
ncbi:MAG TPA: thioredoxin [Desulfobulbus sp.]|nr:thioredoxin [Desulfobulbus sp.]